MSEKRQKNQEQLAFPFACGSEAPVGEGEGAEALRARRETEGPAGNQRVMEEVCERENRREALKRVRANQGSPGIDGMTVDELPEYLEQHWPAIREQLLNGTYEPKTGEAGGDPEAGWRGAKAWHPLARGEEAWITLSDDKDANSSSCQGQCWTGLFSRRCSRFYRSNGTRDYKVTRSEEHTS